jgi:hypothetical protein
MVWRTDLEEAVQDYVGNSLSSGPSGSGGRRRTSRAAPPRDAVDASAARWNPCAARRVLARAGISPNDEDVRLLLVALDACDPLLANVRRATVTGVRVRPFEPRWE